MIQYVPNCGVALLLHSNFHLPDFADPVQPKA